jgi:hypothetical protein
MLFHFLLGLLLMLFLHDPNPNLSMLFLLG